MMITAFKHVDQLWKEERGLLRPRDVSPIREQLAELLSVAQQNAVDALVLPELSVPFDCIGMIQAWSKQTGAIVIGGSHYHAAGAATYSRSPVILGGSIQMVEKVVPAPAEISPIAGEGLTGGSGLVVFRNTRIGDFVVLICSDYLEADLRRRAITQSPDFLIVPAFQRKSSHYHDAMTLDVQHTARGLYIAYANMLSGGAADGHSAFFGLMDPLFLQKLVSGRMTDGKPTNKLVELKDGQRFIVLDIKLDERRPGSVRTVESRPNVTVVASDRDASPIATQFARAVGHDDEKYRKIDEFFVAPREFSAMAKQLERDRVLFVIGDPGIGKTYIAAKLLSEYYARGYTPIWHTGLERDTRRELRQTLEQLDPEAKQAIYFEDPFGSLQLESRDSLHRALLPLVDRLKQIDARVIISSRKEVFEQFTTSSMNTASIGEFVAELSVVKPSYSTDDLVMILARSARGRCPWYSNDTARAMAESAIHAGEIRTPLAIQHLVRSTIAVSSAGELRVHVHRRGQEEVIDFANEIAAADFWTKALLVLVFLAGYKGPGELENLFGRLLTDRQLDDHMRPRGGFATLLRAQIGYRLESFGRRRPALRFAHPSYEDAVAVAGRLDPDTKRLFHQIAEMLLRSGGDTCARSLIRHVSCHGDLVAELYDHLLSVATPNSGAAGTLTELILPLSRKSKLGPADKKRIAGNLRQLANRVNTVQDERRLVGALRASVKYCRGTRDKKIEGAMRDLIDWKVVFELLDDTRKLAHFVESVEYCRALDPRRTEVFMQSIDATRAFRLSATAARVTRLQAAERFEPHPMCELLRRIHVPNEKKSNWREVVRRNRGLVRRFVPHSSQVVVDDGLKAKLEERGGRILPIGLTEIRGEFRRKALVWLVDSAGHEIGVAEVQYSASELRDIRGHESGSIGEILGYTRGVGAVNSWITLKSRTATDNGADQIS